MTALWTPSLAGDTSEQRERVWEIEGNLEPLVLSYPLPGKLKYLSEYTEFLRLNVCPGVCCLCNV